MDPVTGIISAVIDLKPGGSFYIIESTDKNRIFSETEKIATAGPLMDIQVTAQMGSNSPGNTLSLAAMMFSQFGIICYDRDGLQRLVGNRDSGALLLHDYTSGDISTSRSRKITWSWLNPVPAPIYSSQAFNITIGGVTTTAGDLTLILRFRVGDVGAPMTEADTTLTNAGFANKNLLVIASSLAVPCDDGTGDIDWTGSIERHYQKTLAGNTINWIGGVADKEIIEIYAFS